MSLGYTIDLDHVKGLICGELLCVCKTQKKRMLYLIGIIILLSLWLSVLTLSFYRLRKNYLVITQGIHKKSLDVVLSNVVSGMQDTKKDIAQIQIRCDKIEKEDKYHIQKIGLLRFNPFKDTGGDQSFILAFVDAFDSGIVMTALYSRTGTRWYTKRIVRGKGTELELSEEEKKAVKLAEKVHI